MSLPSNYDPSLPRVSDIVSFAFPFEGDALERFEGWLYVRGITVDEYMEEASSGGRFVHAQMEAKLNGEEVTLGTPYDGYVNSGLEFLKGEGFAPSSWETYVKSRDYQGTVDLVASKDGTPWILDWKTYGLAKDKFGLDGGKYRKPSDKLKKAALQLSLYDKAMKLGARLGVIELSKEAYRFHELERVSDKELNSLVRAFKKSLLDNE